MTVKAAKTGRWMIANITNYSLLPSPPCLVWGFSSITCISDWSFLRICCSSSAVSVAKNNRRYSHDKPNLLNIGNEQHNTCRRPGHFGIWLIGSFHATEEKEEEMRRIRNWRSLFRMPLGQQPSSSRVSVFPELFLHLSAPRCCS